MTKEELRILRAQLLEEIQPLLPVRERPMGFVILFGCDPLETIYRDGTLVYTGKRCGRLREVNVKYLSVDALVDLVGALKDS